VALAGLFTLVVLPGFVFVRFTVLAFAVLAFAVLAFAVFAFAVFAFAFFAFAFFAFAVFAFAAFAFSFACAFALVVRVCVFMLAMDARERSKAPISS
jgi:hypothetical protein